MGRKRKIPLDSFVIEHSRREGTLSFGNTVGVDNFRRNKIRRKMQIPRVKFALYDSIDRSRQNAIPRRTPNIFQNRKVMARDEANVCSCLIPVRTVSSCILSLLFAFPRPSCTIRAHFDSRASPPLCRGIIINDHSYEEGTATQGRSLPTAKNDYEFEIVSY